MKSIVLSGTTRKYLKEYDNQSFNKILKKLIDETADDMPKVNFDDSRTSSIKIDDDIYLLLTALAISSTETVDSIVMRMLLMVDAVKE